MEELSANGILPAQQQPEDGSTYAKMLKKEEGKIDWGKDAAFIDRQIRAFNPWPGTWCEAEKGRRLKILETVPMPFKSDLPAGTILDEDGMVVCGDGTTLKLETIQPENKKPMNTGSAYSGGYLAAGRMLT